MPETLTLNSGTTIPRLGFGVFQSAPEETAAAVETALRDGYRLVDTAARYGNEREVGEGIRRSGVPRDEVSIETKIWISDYGYESTLHAFGKSARKLGVDRIDVLLLHQPVPERFDETVDAYRALEKLVQDGDVGAIGVSNFMPHHLSTLLDRCSVVPAINQVELHPYFQQRELQALNARNGILTQAWSPIGGITFYWGENGNAPRSTFDEPLLVEIGERYRKSAAQVMLRWHLQRGRSAIPKSIRPERIAENLDVFDFTLADDELAAIDGLDLGVRGGPDPDAPRIRDEFPIPEA